MLINIILFIIDMPNFYMLNKNFKILKKLAIIVDEEVCKAFGHSSRLAGFNKEQTFPLGIPISKRLTPMLKDNS